MQKQQSVKINMIMNAILTMSSFLFPLITFPYISRVILPVGSGKITFATSVVTYFSMFAQLGIPTYGVKACARVRDNKEELSRVTHEILCDFLSGIVPLHCFYSQITGRKNIAGNDQFYNPADCYRCGMAI